MKQVKVRGHKGDVGLSKYKKDSPGEPGEDSLTLKTTNMKTLLMVQ